MEKIEQNMAQVCLKKFHNLDYKDVTYRLKSQSVIGLYNLKDTLNERLNNWLTLSAKLEERLVNNILIITKSGRIKKFAGRNNNIMTKVVSL